MEHFNGEKTHQMTGKSQKHVLLTTVTSNFRSESCVCYVMWCDDLIYCCVFKSVKMLLLLPLTKEQKAASLVEDWRSSPGSPDNGAEQQRLTQ